ncbi:MAG TPA: hypothetical protein VGU01_02100 [Sphingomicrobium sp.]|nr:hypothetical protein [Sphingomicrobium sp.]
MSSRSFRSVFMVASCAGAALGCYLVSLRVASERAQLEDVESRIVLAERDTRVLQTEIGTRGRLSQLERWNAGAFALSAPAADQFLKGGFELARLAAPERKPDFKAPVVLASAPVPERRAPLAEPPMDDSGAPAPAATPNTLLHEASLKIETREVPARTAALLPQAAARSTDKPATAARSAHKVSAEKPGLAAAHLRKKVGEKAAPIEAVSTPRFAAKKSVDKKPIVTARALTKLLRIAKVDPLAPLPAHHSGNSKGIAAER